MQSNVELLWVVSDSIDPFRPNEKVAEFFVNGVKYETRTEGLGVGFSANFKKELEGYHEIELNQIFENKAFINEDIGLVRIAKNGYYFVTRHLNCFNKIASIGIFTKLNKESIEKYYFLLNLSKKFGEEIYHKAFEYFHISGSEEYFQLENKLTLEEFKTTIELQEVYIDESDFVTIYFRPSWDEEHGLSFKINPKTNEIEIEY